MTVSVFAVGVLGATSPRPSVKNVVPLMYMSAPNPGPAPVMVSAEPAAHCSMPNASTIPDRPQRQEQDQREGAVEAQERVPRAARQQRGDRPPGRPGSAVEQLGESEPAADAPRQDDGLEGVPQDDRQEGDPDHADDRSHDAEVSGPGGTRLC